jgi:hypothetical protein
MVVTRESDPMGQECSCGALIDHSCLFRLMQEHARCPGMRAYNDVGLSRWQNEAEVQEPSPNKWREWEMHWCKPRLAVCNVDAQWFGLATLTSLK